MKQETIDRLVKALVTDEGNLADQLPQEAPPEVKKAFLEVLPELHEHTRRIVAEIVPIDLTEEEGQGILSLLEDKKIMDLLDKANIVRRKSFEQLKPHMEKAMLKIVLESLITKGRTAPGDLPPPPIN